MDVYLPIANLAVNGLVIIGLGALTGVLSGMFGVGGGFLTTPMLIFYGIPPTVAAASAASQVTGASVSGVFAHSRRGGVDYQMGAVLVAALPWRWRFYRSGLYISPLAPLLLGLVTGILTMLMGIGGGFVLVPAMLYILGMGANVVVGTSLFQILFVTMATTMMHALTTHAVDIVLAVLLLFGSVSGAQLGTLFAMKASPARLRLILALIVLAVGARMALGLTYHPDEIFTVSPL